MLILFLLSLAIPLILGVPVAFSLIISAIVLMSTKNLFTAQLVVQQFIGGINSFSLLAVPFFMLAGELMNKGGITKRIVDVVYIWVGRFRGGLGYVSILASMIFAGLSGSALADTAALGGVLIPMMSERGYGKARSTGIVISSAIIANIIPPSIGFILFGVVSGASISRMFMGGIIPGILLGCSLMITWFFTARKDGLQAVPNTMPAAEKRKIFLEAIPALILPVFIIVGLRGGVFTPTEAGAIACAYALIIGMFIYKGLKVSDLPGILLDTVRSTGRVLFIVGGSLTVSWIITASNLSKDLVSYFHAFVEHPIILVLCCQLLFILFGMVLDIVPIIMILVPVMLPIVKAAGVSLEYFGILSIITMTFGLITPPVGTVLYVGSGISKISIADAVKGAFPFMMVEVLVIVALALFPQIITVPLELIM
ncbi:TRAP transporter large permease [Dysosmobacter sp.]|jgi:tripartite ATP-independent transporter DctM subunit|uniref:TRAP transporter large permease n=1 Tax=Dysosmobacter sp. TaxID=2591382 RepID=UPI00267116F2|nr:TRAP transporter large permease [Dysosmobacter sp.]MCI6015215.1 TRAP transporter large permease [Dysosmobacter sp.]MCI7215451.1 TRAP transporter large permease [Dysosmobacter sp.]MDY3653925.1 TRAP transporter large permease [Dysosmobacter sp.]